MLPGCCNLMNVSKANSKLITMWAADLRALSFSKKIVRIKESATIIIAYDIANSF